MDEGFLTVVQLVAAIANGPSNTGQRKDGQICTAQGGGGCVTPSPGRPPARTKVVQTDVRI